jgi:ABC-type nitrate/sulfonate/bicarbonate transport system substrate-binding protein
MGIVGGSQPLWRYVAQRNDQLLAPSGYQVSFVNYPSEASLREAFLRGEVQVMATLPPQLPTLAEAGQQVQYFLPIAWLKQGYPIIVPVDSPIRSVADLVGKRVSTFPLDHPGLAYWRAFIYGNYGFKLEEKAKLRMSQKPETPLLNKAVDAATLDAVAWALIKGQGQYRAVSDLAGEWRRLSGSPRLLLYGGYVANREWLAKHPRFVADFIKINQEALQLYQKDREAFLEVAAAYAGENAPSLSSEAMQFVADYLGMAQVSPERVHISREDVADYQKVFSLLAKAGYLKTEPPAAADLFYLGSP